jgi:hypothetical protein
VHGTLPTALVGLWLVRDVVLMIATHQYVAENTNPGMSVMDPVTVPIQVIPTTLSKINTTFQFITLVAGIISIEPMIDSHFTLIDETTTDAVLTGTHTAADTISNWYKLDWLLVHRMYISDTILPTLCWITGATTIGSSLSYYGHSAFISTKR